MVISKWINSFEIESYDYQLWNSPKITKYDSHQSKLTAKFSTFIEFPVMVISNLINSFGIQKLRHSVFEITTK